MADQEKPKTGPPEFPTTARELDFDDDDVPASPKPKTTAPEERPQPPQRPSFTHSQEEATLKEAFPTIDAAVVKAVLVASGGQVEPAFNALLSMSDPDAADPLPPAQPPRPAASPKPRSQLEQDELFARQLAEHYQNQAYARRDSSRDYRGQDPRLPRPKKEMGLKPNELYDDRERNFIDDDLPVIRDNIRKGFLETQTKVNSFLTNLKKKIDGEDEDEEPPPQPSRPPTQPYRRSGEARRSGDRERYDADPQVLPDDFAALQMDDTTRRRPLANPDLFKPTPTAPQSERKVSFQDNDPYQDNDPTKRPSSTGSRSKWQPLSAVEPSPVADHDPFSLGDSDEEDKRKDIKLEDAERLKKETAEAMGESIGSGKKDEGTTTVTDKVDGDKAGGNA